jgi:hypothetical protein
VPVPPCHPPDEEVKRWKAAQTDSATIAIYTKFNELAERYGVKHRDFVALVRDGQDRKALEIEWQPYQLHFPKLCLFGSPLSESAWTDR